jgi:hypothetical protein
MFAEAMFSRVELRCIVVALGAVCDMCVCTCGSQAQGWEKDLI